MKRIYVKQFIKGLILLSFFVPLIVFSDSFIFPFVVPKILFFRSITIVMLAAYAGLLISSWKEYRPRFTWVHGAVLLFFLSFFISTFVGVDWYKSFWDNHERMLGLFTITHFVLYYIVVTEVITEWREWKFLSRIFLLAGSIVMIIGFWQKLVNPELLLNRGSGRVSATLGNAIYYSGYGMFLFFLGIISGIKETDTYWKIASFVIAFFGFLGILFGGTRGSLVGLLVGLVCVMVYYTFAMRSQAMMRKRLIIILIGGLILCGTLFAFRQTSFVRNLPAVGRLVNSSLAGDTLQTRVMAWKIAIEAWKEKPAFGWGPNNYFFAFNKFYRPEFLQFGFGETWFDNAHSSLFNTFAVQGLFGIMAYVLLFVAPIGMLVVAYRKGRVDIYVSAFGIGFFVAHFVHNSFVFENPTSYLYFFWFLALVNQVTQEHKEAEKKSFSGNITPAVLGGVTVVAVLFIYTTNVQPGRANVHALEAIRASYNLAPNTLSLYTETQKISSPHIDDIRADFSRSFIDQVPAYAQAKRVEDLVNLYPVVEEDLQANLALHPLDIRTHISLSRLFQYGAALQQNPQLMVQSEQILQEAIDLSPKRQQLYYLMVPIKTALGKQDEAISLLKTSISHAPTIGQGWWRLAVTYNDLGDTENAKATIEEAERIGVTYDGSSKKIVDDLKSSLGMIVVE